MAMTSRRVEGFTIPLFSLGAGIGFHAYFARESSIASSCPPMAMLASMLSISRRQHQPPASPQVPSMLWHFIYATSELGISQDKAFARDSPIALASQSGDRAERHRARDDAPPTSASRRCLLAIGGGPPICRSCLLSTARDRGAAMLRPCRHQAAPVWPKPFIDVGLMPIAMPAPELTTSFVEAYSLEMPAEPPGLASRSQRRSQPNIMSRCRQSRLLRAGDEAR